jgi:hypothetical protein
MKKINFKEFNIIKNSTRILVNLTLKNMLNYKNNIKNKKKKFKE